MPPRPGMEPDDLVTPSQAAAILHVPAETVRTWVRRYGIEQLGTLGRWPVYDFREIAEIQARRRRKSAA
jgi:hypothetical protein